MSRKALAAIIAGVVAVAAVILVIAVVSNGDDDGADVRTAECDPSVSEASASCASGSTTGTSESHLGNRSDDPLLLAAVDQYREYVNEQVEDTIARTTVLTDAARVGDVEAAKAAFAPSRQGWERIEPIAGLVEEIDGAVDARVDDFAGVDDPKFTGWHRLEYLVFSQGTTAGAVKFADKLDDDLQTLKTELAKVVITPLAMARGASDLIEEVSEGKITGEEDRYSGTDLWDFAANVQGAAKAIELLAPALEKADPDLLSDIRVSLAAVDATLSKYANPDGSYQPFSALTAADASALKAALAQLSEELAEVPGALNLQ